MAGFQKVGGKDVVTKDRVIVTEALAVGDLVMASRSAYKVTAATSSVTVSLLQGGGIVSKASTATDTSVQIQEIVYGATYKIATTSASNVAHNYQRMTIGANAHIINNTGSDDGTNGVFIQTGVIGASTDNMIIGEFVRALT